MSRVLTLVLLVLAAVTGQAAEIKVLSAGAIKSVPVALIPAFEQRTGHKVVLDNGTAGQLAKRIAGGEAFDVVIVPPGAMKELTDAGQVRSDSVANVGRVGIGIAVKSGAAAPDVASVDAFRRALLSARAVAYIDPAAGGSSGVYLDQLFEKMGIAQQVRAKAVLVPGGLVAERVVDGRADLAIHQISEILAVPGATLVAPLPAEIQNYTVYAAGVSGRTAAPAAAGEFVAALRGADASAVLQSKGMERP